MGCVNSKSDINERHPNIFHVINVNDQGTPMSPGKLEVTESELVLHQRGKLPTRWPLWSLRKYGFDTEVFSFECGRRCPIGEGIYAFRCQKAEQLFNIVQQHITGNINDENPINRIVENSLVSSNNMEFPIPAMSTGPPVAQRRIGASLQQPDGYLTPIQPISRPHTALSRPGSVSSNGQLSPTATSPPPVINELPLEHNNNKRNSLIPPILENGIGPPNYANLGAIPQEVSPICDSANHEYMNIDTKENPILLPNNPNNTATLVNSTTTSLNNPHLVTKEILNNSITPISNSITEQNTTSEVIDERHAYANIDTKDIQNLRLLTNSYNCSLPPTPTVALEMDYSVTAREVNYAELDLENNGSQSEPTTTQVTPDSPSTAKKSYAVIDFTKTIALSQSINPKMDLEEGSRKTRHNSTINSFSD